MMCVACCACWALPAQLKNLVVRLEEVDAVKQWLAAHKIPLKATLEDNIVKVSSTALPRSKRRQKRMQRGKKTVDTEWLVSHPLSVPARPCADVTRACSQILEGGYIVKCFLKQVGFFFDKTEKKWHKHVDEDEAGGKIHEIQATLQEIADEWGFTYEWVVAV